MKDDRVWGAGDLATGLVITLVYPPKNFFRVYESYPMSNLHSCAGVEHERLGYGSLLGRNHLLDPFDAINHQSQASKGQG